MYSTTITARLQYIVNFFSQELFDEPIRITTDTDEYIHHAGPKINYSATELTEHELLVMPVQLLFENGIRQQHISCFDINFHKAFFQTPGTFHFDIFAASFYLLSRYEEYLPHERDAYGRYAHQNSIAFKEGFLHLPLINIWLEEFRSAFSRRYPALIFKRKEFVNLITYDIDMAYSYLQKGFWRNAGGSLRSMLRGEWKLLLERWQVLAGKKKDPFDCFEWLDALHLYCRLKPYYFFLVAKNRSVYDKNISTSSRKFRELVEYYCGTYHVGLHPSWKSGDDPELMKEELEWLEVIADKKIHASRQHYVLFDIPATYRRLVDFGITKEFSMGYGSINGFRASVSACFRWYDLEKDMATSLIIYPFCFMDANAYYEQRLSPGQAYEELMSLYNSVKKVNGKMISIWHNHLLGSDQRTKGWSQMFEIFMKDTVYWDAYYDGRSELSDDVFFPRIFS